MKKEEFQELLHRYRDGNCSLEEIQKVNNWFDYISDENKELSEEEREQVNLRIRASIQQTLPGFQPAKAGNQRFMVLKIAAGFLFAMLLTYVFVNRTPDISRDGVNRVISADQSIQHKNQTQQILEIRLPDSSTVQLKPGAEISYLKQWNKEKREVHLVGEGFFEVVKDSKRPFFVYGGAVITKVLGTSFTVNASRNAKSIEVEVRTGKVSVYEGVAEENAFTQHNETTGVILTPNEKVEYFIDDKHWVTTLVSKPKPLPESNKEVEFVFNDAPMSEIISSIERTYSISILIENDTPYSCTFTGDVSMMELYDLLDVICKSTGTNYEVKGTKILISGKGCQ